MTTQALWIEYFGLGGNGSQADIEEWLAGVVQPSDLDHDYLAQALNDAFVERGMGHPVQYRLG